MKTMMQKTLILGSALVMTVVFSLPAAAGAKNPCAPSAGNPCAAPKGNPCAVGGKVDSMKKQKSDKKTGNPCAAKPANPCGKK